MADSYIREAVVEAARRQYTTSEWQRMDDAQRGEDYAMVENIVSEYLRWLATGGVS